MKDFFILKILDKFKFIFDKLGVNYKIMRSILSVKLIMDERRVPTVMSTQEVKEGNYFMKSLLFYGIMGIFMLLFIIPPFPLFFKMNIVYGLLLFMIISTLVSDFSSVLLDLTEKNILLPKPVDHKTMNMAKTIHILIYLLTISLVISGPSIIGGTIIYGLNFLFIFIFQLFFVLGFSIFLTSLLYFLILQIFNGEKLKDIINYFQIGFSITIAIAYQFIGRAFNFIDFNVVYTPKWWSYLLPSTWFSAPYSLIIQKDYTSSYILLSIIGMVVSFGLLIIYIKIIAPYFEKNLSKLNDNSGKVKLKALKRAKRSSKIASLFTSSKLERIFYTFTKNMISKERNLKLKLFPGLALSIILPVIFLFNGFRGNQSFEVYLQGMKGSNFFLVLYISLLLLIGLTPLITVSEKYNAAWIYKVAPITSYSYIYEGAIKALLINYLLPPLLISSAVFIYVFGTVIIPDIVVIFLNLIVFTMYIFKISNKELPFSQDYKILKEKSKEIFIQSLGFTIALVIIHFLAGKINYGIYIYIGLLLIVIKLFWDKIFSQVTKNTTP